ncbi:MAG TPA: metalloregulator ArsR/SmtB family transcription factor, partial [Geobacteraceae bacterium]
YISCMENIALVFQSLAEEIRLRILALLLEEQELCVCDLMAVLQLPQSTVSRHLSHLKNAGWLSDRREAVWVHYSIAKPLGPLQQSLLPVLRHFLRDEPVAKADVERLRSFNCGNSCA